MAHEPVMVEEVLSFLAVRRGGAYLDLTLGGGGHARAILDSEPDCALVGVDRDRETLERTAENLAEFSGRVEVVHSRFDLVEEAGGWPEDRRFDGILMDLGMSSLQLDDPERGFSFQRDGPLDLRMDRGEGESAADLLERMEEEDLADLLFRYGDERRSRVIARAVVERRRSSPIRRTFELADLVARAVGSAPGARIHPATRTFQALRIAVNDEFGCLERALPMAVRRLVEGGRLVVLSFHSGEDRRVKSFVRDQVREGYLQALTKKAVRPGAEEVRRNRRARSTRLRAAERCTVASRSVSTQVQSVTR